LKPTARVEEDHGVCAPVETLFTWRRVALNIWSMRAVAAEVDESDGLRPGSIDFVEEAADRLTEIRRDQVMDFGHVVAGRAHGLGDDRGVGIRGRDAARALIGRVADDERQARRRRLRLRVNRRAPKQNRDPKHEQRPDHVPSPSFCRQQASRFASLPDILRPHSAAFAAGRRDMAGAVPPSGRPLRHFVTEAVDTASSFVW
jgi:hypothetical protein